MCAVTELHCICTILLFLQMFLSCISCKLLHPATRVISFCTEILVRRRIENCFTRQTMSRRNLLPRSFDHLLSSRLLSSPLAHRGPLSPGCPSEVGLPGFVAHCTAQRSSHSILCCLSSPNSPDQTEESRFFFVRCIYHLVRLTMFSQNSLTEILGST